jgi:hypothetical protein
MTGRLAERTWLTAANQQYSASEIRKHREYTDGTVTVEADLYWIKS